MPKNRKRNPAGKSISIPTKFKIGGRRSGKGAEQMSNVELQDALGKVRKRDRNNLVQILRNRGLL